MSDQEADIETAREIITNEFYDQLYETEYPESRQIVPKTNFPKENS